MEQRRAAQGGWVVRLLVTAVLLGASACGSDGDDASGSGTTGTTAASTTTTAALETQTVAIGEGKELYLQCQGEGSPTVILEAGDESGHEEWTFVQPQVAAKTRTCAYDRLGNARSSDATGCRGLDDIVGDLEKLLTTAELEGPYVFVGASGGGYLAAEMADRHADETKGLVLVETAKAITVIPPDLAPILKCDAPTNIERRDYVGVEHAVWDDRHQIGEFPVIIFSNEPDQFAEGDEVTNVEDQKGWSELSPDFEQIVVDSGHDVSKNEPDRVVDSILGIVATAQAG